MKQLPKLPENLFSEDTHGDVDDKTLDFLDVDWFSEHAIGYHAPDFRSKYRGLVLIMFESDGELCWFSADNKTLAYMNAEFC